jgi:hypothetical protein
LATIGSTMTPAGSMVWVSPAALRLQETGGETVAPLV